MHACLINSAALPFCGQARVTLWMLLQLCVPVMIVNVCCQLAGQHHALLSDGARVWLIGHSPAPGAEAQTAPWDRPQASGACVCLQFCSQALVRTSNRIHSGVKPTKSLTCSPLLMLTALHRAHL